MKAYDFAQSFRVYPRVCGGTTIDNANTMAIFGLSPRVRGNPPRISSGAAILRSIPACAGEPYNGNVKSK